MSNQTENTLWCLAMCFYVKLLAWLTLIAALKGDKLHQRGLTGVTGRVKIRFSLGYEEAMVLLRGGVDGQHPPPPSSPFFSFSSFSARLTQTLSGRSSWSVSAPPPSDLASTALGPRIQSARRRGEVNTRSHFTCYLKGYSTTFRARKNFLKVEKPLLMSCWCPQGYVTMEIRVSVQHVQQFLITSRHWFILMVRQGNRS